MMKSIKYETLGCKVNQYETQGLKELFEERGYRSTEEDVADIYVVNTCTITNAADSKSRQVIRKCKRANPESIVVVMGCYSQISPEDLEEIGVDILIGTKDRGDIVDLVTEYTDQQYIDVTDISNQEDFQELKVSKIEGMTRGYIKVQDGCNQYCSYCIIPYARGPIRSRNPENILKEVEKVGHNGTKEIVITGIHVASFGVDLENYKLIDLIEDISKIESIERIRLSSIDPRAIDREFLERVSVIPKFTDHFHLSLQSGSDTVLKKMNRKYTTEEYRDIVDLIREYYPMAGITTDIIVGFPTETDVEFKETCEFVKDIKFTQVHIFKYSKRQGTPAAKMEQVPGDIKNNRSAKLFKITDKLTEEFLKSQIGTTLSVLVERKQEHFLGHTTNYIETEVLNCEDDVINEIIPVKITGIKENRLVGKYIEDK